MTRYKKPARQAAWIRRTRGQTSRGKRKTLGDIAIIGLNARFPGARNIAEFWQNLRTGTESISFFSPAELIASGVNPEVLKNPNYVPAGSVLEDIALFDASFFGINPREAESMDPQQRLFLECAWHALEDAAYDPDRYGGLIGVYAGCAMSTYFYQLQRNPQFVSLVGFLQTLLGNDKDYLTTHVSYKLNLKGPSVSVQTTCSTSLVAVCLACQGLLSRDCDIALAGGVCVRAPQKTGYYYEAGGIFSPDGHCRVFDAKAQGVIFGNGVGIVVLKRLEEAVADGDYIHAVIKGSAINNDGSAKSSYTAPGVSGQTEVIAMAQERAGVPPQTITYVETHGTATALGDPIEIIALTKAFRRGTAKKNFCAIGSVKTNFGHLDHAAGIAGLIKTVLALKHKLLPPSLNFETPNPAIDFANSPFYVNTTLSEWKLRRFPRRAGVSAFGIGGTNAHVILEEAPVFKKSGRSRPAHVLVLSAKTSAALEAATVNLVAHLKQNRNLDMADVANTLQTGRRVFTHRRMLLCHKAEEAANALETLDPQKVLTARRGPRERSVIFMFSGQGAQYVNMALGLYQSEQTFCEEVELCAELLKPHLGLDLRTVIYPAPDQVEEATHQLKQTALTQPALFVIEYALARLWMEWGVRPRAMIGHSIGEYVAACLAGVFSLKDALALVVERGRLMQQLPGGSMLAVPLPEQELQALLPGSISLAAVNEPSLCVVSGPTESVDQLGTQLAAKGLDCRRLHTSHAFHSAQMDPILKPFAGVVATVNRKAPRIPYVSNVTGAWITPAEATSPAYWAKHLRQTVRFADGLRTLLKELDCAFLEVGPGQTLSTFARRHPDKTVEHVVLPSLRHPREPQSDLEFLLNKLGRLWMRGVPIDWAGFYRHEQRRRLPLPLCPFQRQRYWVEPAGVPTGHPAQVSSLKKPEIAEWFYVPSWKKTAWPALGSQNGHVEQKSRWLIFADTCGVASQLLDRLKQKDQEVVTVRTGQQFAKTGESVYEIDPREPEHYHALVKELCASRQSPEKIVHAWSLTSNGPQPSGAEWFEAHQDLGFYSLLQLTQALVKQKVTAPIQMGVVSNGLHLLKGDEALCPAKATVLGPCKTIPQEYPNIRCCNVDLVLPPPGNPIDDTLADHLLGELVGNALDTIVAYRDAQRWVQNFETIRFGPLGKGVPLLRKGGVYLITGGLGNICLAVAEELAISVQAKLVLVGRSAFPAREAWAEWLQTHAENEAVSRKIRKVQALEGLGAEVMVCSADVSDEHQMRSVVEKARARFGDLHGVIHGAGTIAAETFFGVDQATRQRCEFHFRPKAAGLIALETVLHGKPLDFWLLVSSLSSIVAGLGFVAYSAANVFLNAFASARNQEGGVPWFSVDWDNWKFTDNADATVAVDTALSPPEGVETFRRILSQSAFRRVAVSATDLQARIDQWINFKSATAAQTAEAVPLHSRPDLPTEHVPPGNEVEQTIAGIWQELLGIDQIGIHDNFFELGGQSLLATQLIARVRMVFQTELPLRRFFQGPTVRELALAIGSSAQQNPDELEAASQIAADPLQPVE